MPLPADLGARIQAYLQGGGLFNPELANHDVVRDLIIDMQSHLTAQDAEIARLTTERDGDRLATPWRSIETYPQADTYTPVLITLPSGKVGEASLQSDGTQVRWYWANTEPDDYYLEPPIPESPTHWMPLPPPPLPTCVPQRGTP